MSQNAYDRATIAHTEETIVKMALVAWGDIDNPSRDDVADLVGRLVGAIRPFGGNVDAMVAEVCRRRGV